MAQELRIIRGDTYDLEFRILDENNNPVPLTGYWHVGLESEKINKNSVDDPNYFIIESQGYGTGEGAVQLTSIDTDPQPPVCGNFGVRRLHYKLKLWKDENPAVVKTVSTGDFIIIEEL